MSHFAKVEDGVVTQVIVAEQDFIDRLPDASSWLQTSYNTYKGKHMLGGVPFRKNYAGIGHTYDAQRDAFIAAKPFPSWVLDEDTCVWEPPFPYPNDEKVYDWDEATTSWVVVNP
jgi:hypothetical protein